MSARRRHPVKLAVDLVDGEGLVREHGRGLPSSLHSPLRRSGALLHSSTLVVVQLRLRDDVLRGAGPARRRVPGRARSRGSRRRVRRRSGLCDGHPRDPGGDRARVGRGVEPRRVTWILEGLECGVLGGLECGFVVLDLGG